MTITAHVQCIFADVFSLPQEQISPQSSPETIANWDSVQHLNLVLAIEQEFGVRFVPTEIEQLLSFQHAVELLEHKLKYEKYLS
jgi:acyl carrier protein